MAARGQKLTGVLLMLMASCSSKAGTQAANDSPPDISKVVFIGGPTDEALLRLLDAAPQKDAQQAVTIDSPDLTAPLPSDPPPTLTFHLASQATRAPSPRLRPELHPPAKWQRSLHELFQLLGPERVAHAHGTPYNGTAFYLLVTDADSKTELQVFTSGTSYVPDAAVWQTLAQAPQPLTLSITSAFFEENDIPAESGPFIGGKFKFRIE